MESSDLFPESIMSKQALHSSSSNPSPPDQPTSVCSDSNPWSSPTPEKTTNRPPRVRSILAAHSVEEAREVGAKLQFSDPEPCHQPDPVGSAGQQIGSGPGDTPIEDQRKKVDGSINLPEKFEILCKFFGSLDSSIRLLRLKGSMPTFTNIRPKVECLTDRRFSCGHLAQLKFILPKVVEIKKILVHDERTCCMKPDLHVTLNVDAVKNEGKLNVRKVFQDRLIDFFEAHPEGEVPEGTLPEPFNQSKIYLRTSTTEASSSSLISEILTNAHAEQWPAAASHLSESFQKHFSQQVISHEAVSVVPPSELLVDRTSCEEETIASALKPPTFLKSSLEASQASLPASHLHATPLEGRGFSKNEVCSSVGTSTVQGTPAKLASTPIRLMSATPALQLPKRCDMSLDDDSTSSPTKLVTRPPRSRTLIFDSPVKKAQVEDESNGFGGSSGDSDILQILPDNLLQSIREKERKALEEQDPAISQTKRRQQMITHLPKLFDLICYLFQSINRSVITKEELIYRIVANDLDIVDRSEVEEQVQLLEDLIPEWLYEKVASSGDRLICINKVSSPESMRAKLMEAKGNLTCSSYLT